MNLATQHKSFVAGHPELEKKVDLILQDIGSVELQDAEFEKQSRDAHVVREQEQEAQEEAEEEAEQEEERESKYSREDEQPNPWAVELLGLCSTTSSLPSPSVEVSWKLLPAFLLFLGPLPLRTVMVSCSVKRSTCSV